MTERLEIEQDERSLAEKWASTLAFWWLPTVGAVAFSHWMGWIT